VEAFTEVNACFSLDARRAEHLYNSQLLIVASDFRRRHPEFDPIINSLDVCILFL
jgi:hypothetical protein